MNKIIKNRKRNQKELFLFNKGFKIKSVGEQLAT